MGERRRGSIRRTSAAGLGAALAAVTLAACGGEEDGGTPTLNWFINNAAQVPIGERCTEESGGAYRINPEIMPNTAAGQREQILRRLAASDSGVDIISLDPPYIAELANADFLRPFTDEERAFFEEGMLDGPIEQSIYNDVMWAAPFFGNTQLLWYKKSVAEAGGLDMENPDQWTWDEIIEAAEQTDTTFAVQGRKNESLMVWVNALVLSAGGEIITAESEGKTADEVKSGLNGPEGAEAARIIRTIADSPIAPPAMSTAGEGESVIEFKSDDGGFMVNWPFVWADFDASIEGGSIPPDFKDDVGWTRYPRVTADMESSTPIGGVSLAIGAFTDHPDEAVEAIECLRSLESQKEYILVIGDPGASEALYDDPDVREKFPMADEIREGLRVAGPRPVTPFYGDVTGALQEGYHPPNEIDESAGEETAEFIEAVLSNERLL